jgi:hypothetical protein
MQKTFQFHPRRIIEGSVSRVEKWIPVRSALVEEPLAPIKFALQRVGHYRIAVSGRGVFHGLVHLVLRGAKHLQIVTPRALSRPYQAPEMNLEQAGTRVTFVLVEAHIDAEIEVRYAGRLQGLTRSAQESSPIESVQCAG